jgi:hypothetical protein
VSKQSPEIKKAVLVVTSGLSGQTNTAATQEQPTKAPDGAVVGTVPAAAEKQVDTPSPGDAATNSGGTIVPLEFRFTETQYEPAHNVTGEDLSKLSQDDLLTGLKKQYSRTRNSHAQFGRDLAALIAFYDAVVARYSNERVSKGRNGEPTLREAFSAVGWNYEAARKMKQRYNASMAALPSYAPTPKPLQLSEGDKVKVGDGTEGTVENVHESAAKVDVVFKGHAQTMTIPIAELTKVVVPIKKIKIGDLILCDDNGTEYEYEGHGKFSQTQTATLLEQKRERELATIKAKQEREKAKVEEKKRQQELRKAEAARRDLEKIEKAKAEKEAAREKKAKAKHTKAAVVAKKAKAASAKAKRKTTDELVKSARIGDTSEFGIYRESYGGPYDSTNAAQIFKSLPECEAERDRINAKRAAKPENVFAESNAQQEVVGVL